MTSDQPRTSDRAPQNVRVAGALVGLQGVVGVVVAVVFAVRALAAGGSALGYGLAEAGFFLLLAAAVTAAGVALVLGRRAARTPAIVIQLLLLPFVYSLIGSPDQLVLGIVAGLAVILTFLLLISDQARRWSVGNDYPE